MTDMLINLFIRSFPKFSKPFHEKTEHACGKEQVTDGFKFTHKVGQIVRLCELDNLAHLCEEE